MIHQDMRIFTTVVAAGGFTAAARRLEMSKSTVSHRIGALEARLGARLLQRSTRVVRPTDAGLAYYERCVRILAEIEDAETMVQRQQGLLTGSLRLCIPIEFGMHIMGPIIADFHNEHGHIEVEVELTSRHVDMIEEGFDLALRIGKLADSRLVARKLLSIPCGLFASQAYLKAHGQLQSPADLARHECLHFSSPDTQQTWSLSRRAEQMTVTPKIAVRMNNFTMLRALALAGSGIVILPRYLCWKRLRHGTILPVDGHLVPVLEDWAPSSDDVYMLYPSSRHIPFKVRAFTKHVERALRIVGKGLLEDQTHDASPGDPAPTSTAVRPISSLAERLRAAAEG